MLICLTNLLTRNSKLHVSKSRVLCLELNNHRQLDSVIAL